MIEILNRYTQALLWSGEAETIRAAVGLAVQDGADLRSADLRSANLRSANLRNANLRYSDLRYSDLRYSNLRHSDLRHSDLSDADLRSADLSGADLRYSDLRYSDLRHSDLSDADLRSADLSDADLRSADLSDANLRSAKGISPYRSTPLLMLLDQPGPIRAYKLVTAEGIGPYNGGITYEISQTYEVPDANTDVMEQCGTGINVATLDWCMRKWQNGYRILIVEFTAADIAAIPTATDGKLRLRKCTVVGEKSLESIGVIGALTKAKR